MDNFLGIDFGLKNLGVSIAKNDWVEAYGQLPVKSWRDLLKRIFIICQKEKIKGIIVGKPEGVIEGKVKDFGKFLKRNLEIPIFFQDETLTSKQAGKIMGEIGVKRTKRKKKEHQIAACLILKEWLEKNKKIKKGGESV